MKHLNELADKLIEELRPNFVVDIGSNDGTSLLPYQERGIRVLGVDPSSVARTAKVPTINDFFTKELASEVAHSIGQADLITAYNVFAHTPLEETMEGIDTLLKPSGVFVNESQYLGDIIPELAYDTFYLEHLRAYSMHSMASVLERWGFTAIKVERVVGIGGSIRTFAKKGKLPIDSSVKELLAFEDHLGFQNLQIYTDFAAKVKQSKLDLNALLWKLKKEGNRIVGIGAPGRSTTIINYCGLTPDLVDYLVETSPLKIGLFSPGTEIPIVDEARFLADQPEYAIMFSWHLADKIMPKLRAAGYAGKFVIPLPEVKLVD